MIFSLTVEISVLELSFHWLRILAVLDWYQCRSPFWNLDGSNFYIPRSSVRRCDRRMMEFDIFYFLVHGKTLVRLICYKLLLEFQECCFQVTVNQQDSNWQSESLPRSFKSQLKDWRSFKKLLVYNTYRKWACNWGQFGWINCTGCSWRQEWSYWLKGSWGKCLKSHDWNIWATDPDCSARFFLKI